MKKRILAIFLCICMWATSVPLETFAGELGNVMDNVLSETEEQEQIIEEDNADLSALYRATNSSTVTEEQLYMLAPSYLRAEAYDNIIAKCGAMSLEAIDSVSETDAAIASYMYALKNGTGILWNNLWSNCGMSDSMYSEFEMNAAKELVCEYLKVNENLTKTCKKVEDELGVVDKVYDLTTTAGKESFREIIVKNNPLLTEDEANKMVSALFAETDTMIKYVGEGTELFVLMMAYVEMQMIEIQALDDLIVIHNQVKDTTMRDALAALRYEITRDIGTYIINTYFKDKVLKTLQGMVEDSVKNLTGSVFSVSALSWKLGSLVTGTVASIYEKYKPCLSF